MKQIVDRFELTFRDSHEATLILLRSNLGSLGIPAEDGRVAYDIELKVEGLVYRNTRSFRTGDLLEFADNVQRAKVFPRVSRREDLLAFRLRSVDLVEHPDLLVSVAGCESYMHVDIAFRNGGHPLIDITVSSQLVNTSPEYIPMHVTLSTVADDA